MHLVEPLLPFFPGISMHKGYAFVQFTGPFDARSACLGEDGRTICGQVIDVNMVSEPKPHQQGKGSTKPTQKRGREESPADEYVSIYADRIRNILNRNIFVKSAQP